MPLDTPPDFTDKVALVTGAGSGLGEAAAQLLAEGGARVAVIDIDAAGARRVAETLPDSIALTLDVRDRAAVGEAFREVITTLGGIDIVLNNAGIDGNQAPMHEVSESDWSRVTNVNGDGAFFVLQQAIAALLERGGGSIVNTASAAGLRARRHIAPYSYSKAGLIGLTRSAALEYADRGIRVNAVAPTAVLTPLVEHYIASAADPVATRALLDAYTPTPGLPTARDVAHAIAFLASDRAAWITGHTLPIDGGQGA